MRFVAVDVCHVLSTLANRATDSRMDDENMLNEVFLLCTRNDLNSGQWSF